MSPLQLERQFQRAAVPAGRCSPADGVHGAAQPAATPPGASAAPPASEAAALRGNAPGNTSVEADALPTAEHGGQQPSPVDLAAALAALPPSVSSAAVLDGVWLDMHDICRRACMLVHVCRRT